MLLEKVTISFFILLVKVFKIHELLSCLMHITTYSLECDQEGWQATYQETNHEISHNEC